MPFSITANIGGSSGTPLKIAMMRSNNGQSITLMKDFADVGPTGTSPPRRWRWGAKSRRWP
ncbi:MAG: hypothetical protein ACRD1K_11270 [Acidimicrobiales bacterium]